MNIVNIDNSQIQILLNVALALFLGALIGIEREIPHNPARLCTHMLVCGASVLLIALSEIVVTQFLFSSQAGHIRSDPIRIISAVITGVSFLGAGTIIRSRSQEHVEDLTTAALLLLLAAIGICVAMSQWLLAAGITILTLVILRVVNWVEIWLEKRRLVRPYRS